MSQFAVGGVDEGASGLSASGGNIYPQVCSPLLNRREYSRRSLIALTLFRTPENTFHWCSSSKSSLVGLKKTCVQKLCYGLMLVTFMCPPLDTARLDDCRVGIWAACPAGPCHCNATATHIAPVRTQHAPNTGTTTYAQKSWGGHPRCDLAPLTTFFGTVGHLGAPAPGNGCYDKP